MCRSIVLASDNAGKIAEFNAMLARFNLQVIAQGQLGVATPDETGLSFIDNALIKARHASKMTNLPAIADDSGLEVDVLNGQPGIYSARFAGPGAADSANNEKLLQQLANINPAQRHAQFRCAMVYVEDGHDADPVIAEGILEGEITQSPRGDNGFGYDPVFFIPGLGKTCAELTPEQKNQLSHRAKATRNLLDKLMAIQVISA